MQLLQFTKPNYMNYVSGLQKNPTIPYQHLLTFQFMQKTPTVLFYANQILKILNRGNANTLPISVNLFSIQFYRVHQNCP